MDPLDWLHQWDDYEMYMYAMADDPPGIFMQVSKRTLRDGAEEWVMLYDRQIAPLPTLEDAAEPGSEAWEEQVLRNHLRSHPTLVDDEKAYLAEFLGEQA